MICDAVESGPTGNHNEVVNTIVRLRGLGKSWRHSNRLLGIATGLYYTREQLCLHNNKQTNQSAPAAGLGIAFALTRQLPNFSHSVGNTHTLFVHVVSSTRKRRTHACGADGSTFTPIISPTTPSEPSLTRVSFSLMSA